ncbi:adenosine receptor A1-like [Platysternon megacephalum]|uniref:Adenosine receptor A1-like n=1 Tax=Platysternon megacephalum TaxID=55544 RepID=A0A4D9DPF6_9SAUR|nr:adenosine receptor A1-like [Platysternon megacephalum]
MATLSSAEFGNEHTVVNELKYVIAAFAWLGISVRLGPPESIGGKFLIGNGHLLKFHLTKCIAEARCVLLEIACGQGMEYAEVGDSFLPLSRLSLRTGGCTPTALQADA